MNCAEFKQRLENEGQDCLNDEAADWHRQNCELCNSYYRDWILREAMKAMPLPQPRTGFADESLRLARKKVARKRVMTSAGLSAAAVLLVAVVLTVLPMRQSLTPALNGDLVSEADATEKTVRVVIEAREDRENAMLTIDLAENIEIKGFPGQRRISWHTDVKQGRNLLELPLIVDSSEQGYVKLSYRYNGSQKALQIPIHSGSASS